MNGHQKSDVYAQEKQDCVQHFSQIVKVLTEDEMGHPETGDAAAWLKEVLEYSAIGAAAMSMAGIDGEKEHPSAKKILLEMGEFFQLQDDYLDLFGDPCVTGKVGTDIQDKKCSWLVVQCLQRATPEQYQILKENYRQKEAKKVAQVKALYEEL
ncbi:Farnesyl pyrophosphate synthase [Plecturocebus cupreus]